VQPTEGRAAILELTRAGRFCRLSRADRTQCRRADEIRPDRPQTRRWHYVNCAEGTKEYVPARDCADKPCEGDCVIAAIGRAVVDLTRDDAFQIDALKFLIHFVGDVLRWASVVLRRTPKIISSIC
jgi:Fe-S-cluster-containing hydrogenase component 2